MLKSHLFVGAAVWALAGTATAQTARPTPAEPQAAPEQAATVDDIVVTANRREQRLLDVPIAITAQTGEDLSNAGVGDLRSLEVVTPNLTFADAYGFNKPFLRGVGSSVSSDGAESSIAVYIDDVPRPRTTALSTELVNVQRVEVLKGPQGALYGRNATGGAINIITRPPSDTPTADLNLSYGDFNSFTAEAFISGPLSDRAAGSFSLVRKSRDPVQDNLVSGKPGVNDLDTWFTDAALRFDLSDAVSLTLRADYSSLDDARGFQWRQRNLGSRQEVVNAVNSGNPFSLAAGGTTYGSYYLTQLVFGCAGAVGGGALCTPAQLGGFFGAAGQAVLAGVPANIQTSPDGRSVALDAEPGRDVQDYGTSANLAWDLGFANFTSITSYRHHEFAGRVDLDGTSAPFIQLDAANESDTYTQEFRLASQGESRLQWLLGATYFNDEVTDTLAVALFGTPSPASGVQASLQTEATSIYAQGRYDLGDGWGLTASGRYSYETKDVFYPGQPGTGGVAFEGSRNFDDFSPSVTLEKDFGDTLAYLKYAKGFKSGGINTYSTPAQTGGQINDFEPEEIDSYEFGVKSSLLAGRAQFTAAAFYYDYANLQVERVGGASGGATITLNAEAATVKGIELDLSGRLTDWLRGGVTGAVLDAKYDDYEIDAATAARFNLAPVDNSGNRLISAPRYSMSANLDLDRPIEGSALSLVGAATAAYKSSYFFDAENTPFNAQDSYTIVNLQLGVASQDGRWRLVGFVNNALDEEYFQLTQSNSAGSIGVQADPRMYGVKLQLHW